VSPSIKYTTISTNSPISLGNLIRRINLVGCTSIAVIRREVAIVIWQGVNLIPVYEKLDTAPRSESVVGEVESAGVACACNPDVNSRAWCGGILAWQKWRWTCEGGSEEREGCRNEGCFDLDLLSL
jgi:hypothetical protein